MKKLTIIGLAVCLAFALAAPATAVDVDFSGNYYVRGFYTEHWDLSDTSASNAYMDMRFRLQTVFKVNDILSVTTRFDALDKVWGDGDLGVTTDTGSTDPAGLVGLGHTHTYTETGEENIDFDRAYMTIKAPIGTFIVGRQKAFAWGTSFIDNEGEADRIKYVKKIDNLKLIAIFQKNAENDDAPGAAVVADDDAADLDSENYYLAGIYKMENITAGLLGFFRNDKTTADRTTHEYGLVPYFVAKFGPLDIQGELRYDWGETDIDDVAADIDIKELAYNLEATYNFGPASVMAGYAFVSGDGDGNADDEDSAYGGVGNDWEKLFILTYDEFPVNALGGIGNLSAGLASGAKIIYGGATFSPLDNLELGVVIGKADADEIPAANSEDDYGLEYDFTLNWKIYDNLTYTAIVAFLNAGDFYKEQSAIDADFDDTYALFHQLQLSF